MASELLIAEKNLSRMEDKVLHNFNEREALEPYIREAMHIRGLYREEGKEVSWDDIRVTLSDLIDEVKAAYDTKPLATSLKTRGTKKK